MTHHEKAAHISLTECKRVVACATDGAERDDQGRWNALGQIRHAIELLTSAYGNIAAQRAIDAQATRDQ